MPILKYMSWAAFGLALINLAVAADSGSILYVAGAVSLAICGVLLAALERIVVALEAIRNAVAPMPAGDLREINTGNNGQITEDALQDRIRHEEPELSLDELGKRIDAKRAK